MGKFLIIAGIVLVVAGIVIHFADRMPFLGKLPGDIAIERQNFKFYFPITTSILISILISVVIFLLQKFKN
ncbi:MAG: DUF2905 domain-containing protein [Bacteroidota bacterium]